MSSQKNCRTLIALACLSFGVASAGAESPPRSLRFDITSQSLAQALRTYGQICGQEIIFTRDLVDGITASPLKGEYTAQAALERLLEGTSLTAERSPSGVLMIKRSEQPAKTAYATAPRIMAFADGAADAGTGESADSADAEDDVLEEITVTSTRQAQPLSKVPLSVVATDQETLDKQGVRSAADLMRLTPSVTFGQGGQFYGTGQSNISIRGIQSTSGIPTTGVYIDDTPIQTRTGISPSLSNAYPQIFDVDRVEVLRGPQGTLFGTGSMGGAVRFITPDPSLDESSLYTRSEVASTENGGLSYEQGVAGGAPLVEDKLGFRASAWHRYDAGYVDRLDRRTKQVVQRDIDDSRSDAARLAVAWKPVENFTLTPSVFFQRIRTDDASLLEVAVSDPERNEFAASFYTIPQSHSDRFVLPALKATLDLGSFTLISNTSYFRRKTRTISDDTALNVQMWAYAGPFPPEDFEPADALTRSETTQSNLTQELRLQSADPTGRFNWVIGGFYAHSITHDAFDGENLGLLDEINYGLGLQGQPPVGSLEEFFGVGLYQGRYVVTQRTGYYDLQRSLFAQVDYAVLPRLKLTAGLRYTRADFRYQNFIAGPLYATDGMDTTAEVKSDPLTPKFGVSFQANDDNLFYANAAKGVRGSGIADAVGALCVDDGAAIGFDPFTSRPINSDTVWSYEVGSKNRLAEGRFAIDASAYHVDWDDLQTTTILPGCGVNTTLNLGSAKIDGVDLALSAQVLRGLTVGVAASYMDARYTSELLGPNDSIVRRRGEPLDVAPWSFHLSSEYAFRLGPRDFYVRADHTRTTHDNTPVDTNSPLIDPAIPRPPATSVLDLRAGARFGDLDVSLFAGNVLNASPYLSLGHDTPDSVNFRTTTYRPRTIGITATFRK
jgi:iron complex outermembrane receptor protein